MMKIQIPELSTENIYSIIGKVAKNHKDKFFDIYESEDIEQEVWVIALNKLAEFRPDRRRVDNMASALENWLNVIISRRLNNLHRDKYLVKQKQLKKANASITSLDVGLVDKMDLCNCVEDIIYNEFWHNVISQLSEDSLIILESLMSGEKLSGYYKNRLSSEIKKIVGRNATAKKTD